MTTAMLIGGFRLLDRAGQNITPRSKKACCIIAYLLLSKRPEARRELLVSLLWSESDEGRGRASLRQSLKELRCLSATCQAPFLKIDKNSVALCESDIRSDVADVRQALQSLEINRIASLLFHTEPELLSGFEPIDPIFDSWLRVERESTMSKIVHAMIDALGGESLNVEDRVRLSETILSIDPLSEEAIRSQVEVLFNSGKTKQALDTFESYRLRLAEEYDLDVTEELKGFVDRIRNKASLLQAVDVRLADKGTGCLVDPVVTSRSPATGSPKNRVNEHRSQSAGPKIAICPKFDWQDHEDIRYVTEAFASDVVSTMSRFSEWTVVNLNLGSLEVSGNLLPEMVVSLGQKGLDYLVECDLSSNQNRILEVVVSLHDCATSKLVFTERYKVKSYERFTLLNEIACKVASCLQGVVATSRLRKISKSSEAQRAAYDFWLEGWHLFFKWEQNTEDRKIQLFERAISLDPQFANAYSSLAAVYNSRWFVLPGVPEEIHERKRTFELANMAVKLDPLDSRNHVNLAWSHLLAGRHECSELHFGIALNLNSANPNVLMAAALAHAFNGEHESSQTLCNRAFELNPAPPDWYYGYRASIAFLDGQFGDCVDAALQANGVFPDIFGWSAAAHYRMGNMRLALNDLDQFYDNLRTAWAGSAEPDAKTMRDWFTTIFPIKHSQQREVLKSSIDALGRLQLEHQSN